MPRRDKEILNPETANCCAKVQVIYEELDSKTKIKDTLFEEKTLYLERRGISVYEDEVLVTFLPRYEESHPQNGIMVSRNTDDFPDTIVKPEQLVYIGKYEKWMGGDIDEKDYAPSMNVLCPVFSTGYLGRALYRNNTEQEFYIDKNTRTPTSRSIEEHLTRGFSLSHVFGRYIISSDNKFLDKVWETASDMGFVPVEVEQSPRYSSVTS
ncbi:MAG: hypothetical protein ACI83O_000056 [Patescibacteria group bacterium]|jgi:hypothetical protein